MTKVRLMNQRKENVNPLQENVEIPLTFIAQVKGAVFTVSPLLHSVVSSDRFVIHSPFEIEACEQSTNC
jgi:hypothetical protein